MSKIAHSLHALLTALFPLTNRNEKERFLEQMLQIILPALLVTNCIALVAFALLDNDMVVVVLTIGLFLLLLGFWLVWRRWLKSAGIFVSVAIQGTFAYLMLQGRGIYDEALLMFPLAFLISSLLLPHTLYILFTFINVSFVIGLAYAESISLLDYPASEVRMPMVITLGIILIITAVTARLLSASLRQALIHSRQKERALAESTAYLTLLSTISDTLHRSLDYETIANQAVTLIARYFHIPLVAMHTLDLENKRLTLLAQHNVDGPDTMKTHIQIPLDQSLSGLAAQQKEPIISHNIRQDHRVASTLRQQLVALGYESALAIPIVFQERVLGIINLLSKTGQKLPPDMTVQLKPLAQSIGLALHNAEIVHQRHEVEQIVRQQARRALALSEMSQHLAEVTHDYRKTLNIIVRRLAELIGDSCSLSLISADGEWIEMVALYHPNPAIVAAILEAVSTNPQRVTEGHVGRVLATGQPLLIPESASQELKKTIKPEYRSLLDRFPMYSRVMVPLRVQGKIMGITDLTRLTPGKTYTSEDVLFLRDLADRAALAISNARLYDALQQELRERQKAEAAQVELIAQLEYKNEELEQFAYTVSHDLKSPLVTIRGFLGFVAQDAMAGNLERLQADMEHIHNATDKMYSLINELLELSRIGRLDNPPEKVAFMELVAEAVRLVSGQLAARNIVVDIAPDLPVVYVDRPRLVGALQNLLANSAKFMGQQPQPRVEIGAEVHQGETVFFVRDNGIGIAPAYHEKIFTLFERLDSHVEGTGMGLALVKRIIELHNGRIWVKSAEQDQGTTFYFTLNLAP